jgi:hypothetical protein
MSEKEKAINLSGKGKEDGEAPSGVIPDFPRQLLERKKALRSAQLDLANTAGEELICRECGSEQVLHVDSVPKYNDHDELIMFCINQQCGYTNSLPSLGKEWMTVWEKEIDEDKLTKRQTTFLDGLDTIDDIYCEMVKLKMSAPRRCETPTTPTIDKISEANNGWKETQKSHRNPFRKVHSTNTTSEVSAMRAPLKIGTNSPTLKKIGINTKIFRKEEIKTNSRHQSAPQELNTQKEIEALLVENALMKGQIQQLISTVSRLESLLLGEGKGSTVTNGRQAPRGRVKNGRNNMVARQDDKSHSAGDGENSGGENCNSNDVRQGGDDNCKGEGENTNKGEVNPEAPLSYAAATASRPTIDSELAKRQTRNQRERKRALALFTAPPKPKAAPKEWKVMYIKWYPSEKVRKKSTPAELQHLAVRMLEQLRIRKLVKEVSIMGKHIVSLYYNAESHDTIREALEKGKITLLNKLEPIPDIPEVQNAATNRVAFLRRRYKHNQHLSDLFLQDLDTEALRQAAIAKSEVRHHD